MGYQSFANFNRSHCSHFQSGCNSVEPKVGSWLSTKMHVIDNLAVLKPFVVPNVWFCKKAPITAVHFFVENFVPGRFLHCKCTELRLVSPTACT
jgi:hypothetical protein